jgi:peptidoglycan/xylan/chitin deacetylase (PgdA/CDA1 family)
LRRERVRATFFMIGSLVVERPDPGKVLHAPWRTTTTHPVAPAFAEPPIPGSKETRPSTRYGAERTTLFGPPGGATTTARSRRAPARAGRDERRSARLGRPRTPKQIAKDVLRRVRAGSIVLLHDGGGDAADTIAALPRIIRGIRKMNLRLVTLDPYRRR